MSSSDNRATGKRGGFPRLTSDRSASAQAAESAQSIQTPSGEEVQPHLSLSETSASVNPAALAADPAQIDEARAQQEARELMDKLSAQHGGPDVVPDVPESAAQVPNSTDIDPDALNARPAAIELPSVRLPALPPRPWAVPFIVMWRGLNAWVDGAAGYDDQILASHGTASDHKRRRNIGRAIVVATLVGSLGWLVKIAMAFQTWWGIPVALLMASLYGVLSYSMESFFAANVNPFAHWWSKALSLTGRASLSALIAFASALPWVTMSLKSSLNLELARMQVQEKAALRDGVDRANGVGALTQQTQSLEGDLNRWSASLTALPQAIQDQLNAAATCQTQYDQLSESATKRTTEFSSRLASLAKLEANAKGNAQKIKAVATERNQIRAQQIKLAESVSAKKTECADLSVQSRNARDAHIKLATEQTQAAQMRLAQMRSDQDSALAKVREERMKTDAAVAEAASENSSGEFMALVHIVSTQLYAQVLAGLIFMGLFIVDVLPLTLRIFARPGPYDYEKRVDDEIRMMRSLSRESEAKLFHSAHSAQVESAEFRKQMEQQMRPHIRSILMDRMEGRMNRMRGMRKDAGAQA